MKLTEPLFEGVPTVWTIHLGHGAFEIVDYYLPMDACAEAFQASGFRNFRVRPIELSSRRDDVDDRACWADLLNHPQAILIDCAKE